MQSGQPLLTALIRMSTSESSAEGHSTLQEHLEESSDLHPEFDDTATSLAQHICRISDLMESATHTHQKSCSDVTDSAWQGAVYFIPPCLEV